MLTGGPGQPGVSLLSRVRNNLHPDVLREYRLVMFDQRGTGSSGINCPSLQAAIGGSDFLSALRGLSRNAPSGSALGSGTTAHRTQSKTSSGCVSTWVSNG